mgnify:CR=1 FL=1
MSAVLERRSLLAAALAASLLVHGLAVALLPHARVVVKAAVPPVEWMVVETLAPPALPPKVEPPVARTPRAAKRAAPPRAPSPSAAVTDQRGELPAPVTPDLPRFILQPFGKQAKAEQPPAVQAPGGPPVETDAVLESEVKAPYPESALAEGVDGEVVLKVSLGEDGTVRSALVESEPGYGLGEAARAAVMKARFRPAMRDGRPVPSTLRWRYRFVID